MSGDREIILTGKKALKYFGKDPSNRFASGFRVRIRGERIIPEYKTKCGKWRKVGRASR